MDLGNLNDYLIPIVVIACLCVNYVIKATPILKSIQPYNTLIASVLGAVLGGAINGFTIEVIVMGVVSGLASTKLNQLFKEALNFKKGDS